jgi:hypothetical protein
MRPLALDAGQRALLGCARLAADEAWRRELAGLLGSEMARSALIREARAHGLGPLLWRHVRAIGPTPSAADPALAELRDHAQETAARNLASVAELLAVLEDLRRAGVPALAIKGPVSAMLCYGDIGLRSYSDLDLVVDAADVAAATACLEARGYAPPFALAPPWRDRLLRSDSELLFRHRDGRRLVDLHWSLLPRGYSFTPGRDGIFGQRRTVRIGSHDVPTLGTEATLVFLLLHGAKHDWRSLGWLCDVAELLRRRSDLDWDAIVAWSARPGPRRLIDVGLALVHGLLDAPVPVQVLARGQTDGVVARVADRLAQRLFAAPDAAKVGLPPTPFSYPYLRAMELARDRVRFIHDVFLRPTPLEWQAVPLPIALAPLHYLVRPARLLWKHRSLPWLWAGRA